MAAFEDLAETIGRVDASSSEVDDRLAILIDVLAVAGRTPSSVCHQLGGILQDQRWEISTVRNELDQSPVDSSGEVDALAGTTVEDRLDLCRRHLRHVPAEAIHVVWLAYQHAHIRQDRQSVGRIEFFDGAWLRHALNEQPINEPELVELANAMTRLRGTTDEYLPSPDSVPSWIAARVDLGATRLPTAVASARDQVDAVVQLAAFYQGRSTWQPLSGHFHLLNGRAWSFESFHADWPGPELKAKTDDTASEFEALDHQLGPLPMTDPLLHRLIGYLRDVNMSGESSKADLLLTDIRAIEFVARQCTSPDWHALMNGATADSHAWNRAAREIARAVNAIPYQHDLILDDIDGEDPLEALHDTDLSVEDLLGLVPHILDRGPDHHRAMRRLRDLARRTATPSAVRQWIDELKIDYRRQLNRAERFRNNLTHGDPAPPEVAQTVRILINTKARNVLRVALEAALGGIAINTAIDDWRREFKTWRQGIAGAPSASEALFPNTSAP